MNVCSAQYTCNTKSLVCIKNRQRCRQRNTIESVNRFNRHQNGHVMDIDVDEDEDYGDDSDKVVYLFV